MVEEFQIDGVIAADIMGWTCRAVPLLVTEVILQAQKNHRDNIALAKKKYKKAVVLYVINGLNKKEATI